MTGVGKSTFISKLTGRSDVKIGHSLESCTQTVEQVPAQIDGQRYVLVDTPGFSDTNMTDTDVLLLVADHLFHAYKKGVKLSGIIYLHPISDSRMTHQNLQNLRMFRKLTGDENLDKDHKMGLGIRKPGK